MAHTDDTCAETLGVDRDWIYLNARRRGQISGKRIAMKTNPPIRSSNISMQQEQGLNSDKGRRGIDKDQFGGGLFIGVHRWEIQTTASWHSLNKAVDHTV